MHNKYLFYLKASNYIMPHRFIKYFNVDQIVLRLNLIHELYVLYFFYVESLEISNFY